MPCSRTRGRPKVAAWFHAYSRDCPGGANQALGHFTTIWNWGRSNGHLPHDLPNPASPLRCNRRAPRGRMLNSEDLHRLSLALDRAPRRIRDAADAIRLMLLTGCRSGEILRLTWDEVKPKRLALSQTKTGARSVPLNKLAVELLTERQKSAVTPFVFPSPPHPDRPQKEIWAAWNTIKKKADLPPTLRLHDLRHTYASHALLAGESLYVAGKLLGHRKVRSTQVYAHLDGSAAARAADRIAKEIAALMGGVG